jgi:hypothetical protein
MKKNIITVSIPFSFKGETYSPRSTINLDEHMELAGIPCLYTHIAEENNISPYSYEHDVMMVADLEFEHAEGMVAEFIHDGHFDTQGFEDKWKELKLIEDIQAIATRWLGSGSIETDIDQNPALKSALLEAYELGRETGRLHHQAIHSTTGSVF